MKKLIVQAFSFFGISGIGWIMDMCVYTLLLVIGIHPSFSNMLSSLVAITFVYFVSTKKLFTNKETLSVKRKYIIYVLYQVCIVLLSSFVIGVVANWLFNTDIQIFINYSKILAKIFVTPFTMVTNFIFMKILIEKV